MADATDLKSVGGDTIEGSTPSSGTTLPLSHNTVKHAQPTFIVIAAAAAALIAGCASAPIEVNDSQLNWLNITYQPSEQGAKPCRINLIGVGSIEFMEGRSPRVADSFSQDTGHAHWQDVYQEKLGVPPDIIRGWMQIFVDAGVMDKSKSRPREKGAKRDLAVFHVNINREKAICITDDEELVGHVRHLVSIIKSGKANNNEVPQK